MNKTTKILLSLVGLGAIVVPALLLMFLSPKVNTGQVQTDNNRTIDAGSIQNIVNGQPVSTPTTVYATPYAKPASPSAQTVPEGSPSAQ